MTCQPVASHPKNGSARFIGTVSFGIECSACAWLCGSGQGQGVAITELKAMLPIWLYCIWRT